MREIIVTAGMIIGIIGAVLYVVGVSYGWTGVVISGTVLLISRLNKRIKEEDRGRQRLISISMVSAIALCVAAYLMMEDKQYWLLPLMISSVLEIYVSFRLK